MACRIGLVRSRFDTATVIVLPGTGSDAQFANEAFATAFGEAGATVVAVNPDPTGVARGYRAALDEAAGVHGRIVVAGISLGAAVAAQWAAKHQSDTIAVALALPAWTGDPAGSPAAASAQMTAEMLRTNGLDAVIATMTASSPPWLSRTLQRSWAAQWPDLPRALDEAACHQGPSVEELAQLDLPAVVVGAADDAVHPISVAHRWARYIPHCTLRTVTLDRVGLDPGCIGKEAVEGLIQWPGQPPSC